MNELKTKFANGGVYLFDLKRPLKVALLASAVEMMSLVPTIAESRSPTAGVVAKVLSAKMTTGTVSSATVDECLAFDITCLLGRPTGSVPGGRGSGPGDRGGEGGGDTGGGDTDGGNNGGPKGNNGFGNGNQDAPGGSQNNNNAENEQNGNNNGNGGGNGGGQGRNK